ncbi:MAG: 3-hydroxyacyl-ACP dehydratase FabZ [Rhodospirillaceae bacterium]|jgi:3-hydroxyacyl-[acyl-carrier-protein] dehydratase|nr:3-hydroxyacyl-ACP dehydratase FabZ [Rhodospirillaceae bacterium]MBT4589273.1 3-hydroxyacyl-ACP dehydratase FabZ [Rhodospirillaceae bacterium]MBT5941104.1 3-hydroxyacyl-ACP dehydratase FabZ [Rhodospirillaceae bacterium]
MDSDTSVAEDVVIDIEKIVEMIPHRYPFLMIDRVTDLVPEVSAIGHKNVTINEPHFQGHFPTKPVMPGVLIVEAMAQTSAVLVVHSLGGNTEGKLVYFMSVENAKFRRPVQPGDVVKIHVQTKQHRKSVWKFDGVAKVDGQVVAEATFTAMIMDQ